MNPGRVVGEESHCGVADEGISVWLSADSAGAREDAFRGILAADSDAELAVEARGRSAPSPR